MAMCPECYGYRRHDPRCPYAPDLPEEPCGYCGEYHSGHGCPYERADMERDREKDEEWHEQKHNG